MENIKRTQPQLAEKHKFIFLTRELNIRRRGSWVKSLEPVFPSYIIMQTSETVDLQTINLLKGFSEFYHFLKSNTEITPLAGNDLEIIKHLLGLGPKIGPSRVRFDENDRIVVVDGPLKGFEGNIIKVDRRKQRAKICVDFAGASHKMDLSFEDISKKD